jgi:hypothetical protein
MDPQIPLHLELHLQDMGLMSKELEEMDDPVNGHYVRDEGPLGLLDEDGEPQW